MVLLLAAALAVRAQESKIYRDGDTWVQEVRGSLDQPSVRTLKLITDAGSVRVSGANQSGITYIVRKRVRVGTEDEARRAFEQFRVSISAPGEYAVIRAEAPRASRYRNFAADFNVNVPRALDLVKAETGGGGLDVANINGRVEAETGGGNISMDEIWGAISARSGGGNVDIGHVGEIRIETGGGNIRIHQADGNITAESGGGNIHIEEGKRNMELHTGGNGIRVNNCGGDLVASTGGGTITAGNVNGRAKLETGGGSIHLGSANGPVYAQTGGGSVELYKLTHGATAETGSGGIVAEFIGAGRDFGESRLETAAGDIRVFLPQNLPVSVYAAIDVSNGHAIHSDFSDLKITSSGNWGPGETYCKGDLNGGGPTLHVHTTTGSIDFLRTAAANRNPN